ncbi:hypothetical protein D3C78_807750 [compost metagenome]
MLHLHLAAQLEHLAGAADAHAAGLGNHQAKLGRRGMHGLTRRHPNTLAGSGELHLMQIGIVHFRCVGRLLGELDGIGLDLGRGRAERLLMVTGHVIAAAFKQTLDRMHVRGRAAAEDFPFHVVRGNQLHQLLVQVAAIARPGLAQAVLLTNDVQAEVVDPRRHVLQLAVIDDVFRRARAVHKDHVDIAVGVVEPAGHGHHRGDADAATEVQHLGAGEVDGVEQPDRAVHRQLLAFVQGVVQPVGDLAAGHALDGHREAVGHRRRAGDGVGAHDRLAVDLQLQGDELPGLEEEHDRLVGHEAEGAHIPGFLDHLDATDDVAAVGPGLGADRIEEAVGHARLHGRLRPDGCDSA